MRVRKVVVILTLALTSLSQHAVANCSNLVTEVDAIQLLTHAAPAEVRDDDRPCISQAISLLQNTHSLKSIPLLISYLPFHREEYQGEKSGVFLKVPMDGNEYPAVVALSQLGDEVRVPLLVIIESDKSSPLERDNAASALFISFYRENAMEGLHYMINAEDVIGPAGRKNLKAALAFLKTSPGCLRNKDECASVLR